MLLVASLLLVAMLLEFCAGWRFLASVLGPKTNMSSQSVLEEHTHMVNCRSITFLFGSGANRPQTPPTEWPLIITFCRNSDSQDLVHSVEFVQPSLAQETPVEAAPVRETDARGCGGLCGI